MESYRAHFSHFLDSRPERLHFAAHSHHPWPNVSRAAQLQVYVDAAEHIDDKWSKIFGQIIPEAQGHVARVLDLPTPSTVVFAPNTHELVGRIVSALPPRAAILSTDSEFHSYRRQASRWVESGRIVEERLSVEPFATFEERFLDRAQQGEHDMVFVSSVFFNSGYRLQFFKELVEILRNRDTVIVIDGYHEFMALPVSLREISDRVFYLAGGYKYAMAGEGACFLHCPPGLLPRPENTGWFASFAELDSGAKEVAYSDDAMRFAGSTFDPSGLYRFNAVQRWLSSEGLDVEAIHRRAVTLWTYFLALVSKEHLKLGELVPGAIEDNWQGLDVDACVQQARGHFLTFRSSKAEEFQRAAYDAEVMTDRRGDRWRLGFGLYQDMGDVEALVDRLLRDHVFRHDSIAKS